MGFLSGSVTVQRFTAAKCKIFGEDHLRRLTNHAAGPRIASADGIEVAWTATDSVLDTDFTLEKNVYPQGLLFDLRTVTNRLPADMLHAYRVAELKALSKGNPSGMPSAKQKKEAKENARDRIEEQAKDGRFLKRKCDPVFWDGDRGEVYFGSASLTNVDRLCALFAQTFGIDITDTERPAALASGLEAVTAARLALDRHPESERSALANFTTTGSQPPICAWQPDESRPDFLGSEFLLWLWFKLDVDSDTLKLPDGSEATLMLARSLSLECPRGQTGREAFKHEGPTRLPEVRRAIQSGKLPRKVGVTLVRHDWQFEFTLDDMLTISGAKLPPAEDATGRALVEHRLDATRALLDAVEQLHFLFLDTRFGKGWAKELERMRRWLGREERKVA